MTTGAVTLWDEMGDDVLWEGRGSWGDVEFAFSQASRVIRETFTQHRRTCLPMECRGGLAAFDEGSGELIYTVSHQNPHAMRMHLAAILRPASSIRLRLHDVGGSFGLKSHPAREDVAVCLASMLGCRRLSTAQYPPQPVRQHRQDPLAGTLRLHNYAFEGRVVTTNKASYVAYRGPWEVECWVRERLLDRIGWVAVDVETGVVEVLRYLVVEDCGRMINPAVSTDRSEEASPRESGPCSTSRSPTTIKVNPKALR